MSQDTANQNGQGTERGFLRLLVGDERATSDAGLGIALRASGHSLRVHIIEFLKTGRERGEVVAASFLTGLSITQYGLIEAGQTAQDVDGPGITKERVEEAMNEAKAHVQRRVTNILILDGVLSLVDQGVVEDSRLQELVETSAPWLDVVATGSGASDALKDLADSVTVMETTKDLSSEAGALRRGIHY